MDFPATAKALFESAFFAPATAGIALALSVLNLMGQFRAFRTSHEARFRDLEARTKAVTFWETWYKAQASLVLPEDPADVLHHARDIARLSLNDLALAPLPPPMAPGLVAGLQRTFLIDRPRSAHMWLFRTPFFLSILVTGAFLVGTVKDWSAMTRPGQQGESLLTTLAAATVALFFRFVTLRIERAGRRPPEAASHATKAS